MHREWRSHFVEQPVLALYKVDNLSRLETGSRLSEIKGDAAQRRYAA